MLDLDVPTYTRKLSNQSNSVVRPPHHLDVMVNCLFDTVARQTVDSLKVYCLNSIKLVETGNQNSQTRLGNR